MIKLIIFDFDDTLTDNRYLDFESFTSTCKKFNFVNPLTLTDLVYLRKKNYTANSIVHLIKKLSSNNFVVKLFLNSRKNFLDEKNSNNLLHLKPGTKKLLIKLQQHKINICLCTVRKNKPNVLNFLLEEKIFKYFDLVLSTDDIDKKINNNNRDNRILLKSSFLIKIIQKYKYMPTEILYIGNSNEDFLSTKFLNINFIKIDNEYLPKEKTLSQFNVTNMENLNKIIFKLVAHNA